MKLILTALTGLLIFSSCKKQAACNLVPVKMVSYDCDRMVFQVLNNDFIGDTAWTDLYTGIRYTNVVSYTYICAEVQVISDIFDTLFLNMERLNSPPSIPLDCIQCQMVTINNPVYTNVKVTEVSNTPCAGTARGR